MSKTMYSKIYVLFTLRNTHMVTKYGFMENVAQIMRLNWTGGWFSCLIYRLVMRGPNVNRIQNCQTAQTLTNRRIVKMC
jgi:hypothetical protein